MLCEKYPIVVRYLSHFRKHLVTKKMSHFYETFILLLLENISFLQEKLCVITGKYLIFIKKHLVTKMSHFYEKYLSLLLENISL